MTDEIKENAVVERISPTGTICVARVRWVNEEGQAGVTYISPDSYKGGAAVVSVEELKLIDKDLGAVFKFAGSTEELKEAIARLRSMRLPKKGGTHKAVAHAKRQTQANMLASLISRAGSELDGLIAKAVKEIEEEKGGDNRNGD